MRWPETPEKSPKMLDSARRTSFPAGSVLVKFGLTGLLAVCRRMQKGLSNNSDIRAWLGLIFWGSTTNKTYMIKTSIFH